MPNESRLEGIRRRYFLALTPEWKQIREEFLNYIVKASSGTMSPEKIQGMLILVGLSDSWIADFEREKGKQGKE